MKNNGFISGRLLIPLVICLVIFQSVCADGAEETDIAIIWLKNKGQIQGVIMEETEDGIVVDVGYGTVAMSKNEIEKIEKPAGDDKEHVVRTWERKRTLIEKARSPKERKKSLEKFYKREEESLKIKQEMAERIRKEKEHRISFVDSSKIVAEAVLNGEVKTPLLVDTGATFVLIPLEIAEQLTDVDIESLEKVETKLADGTVREGIPVMLESVEVAGVKAENVQAVAMDLQGGDGLLGMSFLSRFHVRIDSKNKELVLKEK